MQTSTVFLRVAMLTLLVSAFVGVPAGVAEENQVRGETGAESMARLLSQVEPRIKAIYEPDEFRVRSFDATWLPDSSGYLKLETSEGASGPEIARYDSASGKRTVVAGEKLLVPGANQRLKIHGFVCSPTGKRFLLHTEEAGGSDRWLYELESGDLRSVKAGDGVGFEANAFSPDGERLLGSRGADLLVYDIASGQATPLTQDGEPDTIHNGSASWSPDGQWIDYVQSDSSTVPKRAVLVPGDPTSRTFRETRYERIGGPISTLRIGVVGVNGGPTR